MTWDVLKKESFMVPPWWVTPLRAAEQNYASLHRTPSARFTDLPITPIDSMAFQVMENFPRHHARRKISIAGHDMTSRARQQVNSYPTFRPAALALHPEYGLLAYLLHDR
jgi:hypothetical protein